MEARKDPLFRELFGESFSRFMASSRASPACSAAPSGEEPPSSGGAGKMIRRHKKHLRIQEKLEEMKAACGDRAAMRRIRVEDASSRNPALLLRAKSVPDSVEVPRHWREGAFMKKRVSSGGGAALSPPQISILIAAARKGGGAESFKRKFMEAWEGSAGRGKLSTFGEAAS